MSAGDDGIRWTPEHDRVPDDSPTPDDMSARAAAAARAFAALSVTDRAPTAPVPPAADSAARAETGTTPLRPDAVLRGRRFTPVDREGDPDRDAERDHDARTERRRAFDERRRNHGLLPDDDAPASAAGTAARPRPRPRVQAATCRRAAPGIAPCCTCWPSPSPVARWWPRSPGRSRSPWERVAGATARSAIDHGPAPGRLVRRGARRATSWLRPRSFLWLPVLLARTLLIAMALPALVGAAVWVVTEGTDGIVAAARAAMWADAFRVAAAVLCFMLVTGVGDARHRRAAQIRRALDGRSPAVRVAVAGAAIAVAVAAVGVVPRAAAGGVTGRDGLAWVPGPLHGTVDGFRDDIAVAEVQSASECLSGHQGVQWRPGYTRANAPADDDVARLTAEGGNASDADLATAAVALHDLLAPWVDTIVVEAGDEPVLVVDRHDAAGAPPVTDASSLIGAATVGQDALESGSAGFDRAVALDCASPPLP